MGLVDADALIAQIWEEHKKVEESHDSSADELKEVFCGIVALVDEQPTAYNPDKVVKQLEEIRPEEDCFDNAEEYKHALSRHNKIIEIVKGGGVDE